MKVFPACCVTAISKLLAAIERNDPPRSLRERHTFSTNGDSDGLYSNSSNTPPYGTFLARDEGMEQVAAAHVRSWARSSAWAFVIALAGFAYQLTKALRNPWPATWIGAAPFIGAPLTLTWLIKGMLRRTRPVG
jgi:hypothetical protein